MSSKARVLIVEDEIKIAQLLSDFLQADGYATDMLHDGAQVIEHVKSEAPDFILLDVMLPNKDGLSLCKEIRQFSEVPILMLTARVDEIDRLMGLGFGADDYVCKPFSAREVVARVHAILKRVKQVPKVQDESVLDYKNVSLDENKFLCLVSGQKVELTPVEFNLLRTLMSRPGQVFSRAVLMDNSYKDARIVSNRTIDSHMKNLRGKINAHQENDIIHTIYGVGYKLE
ncbi:response regulator [Glaciecola sp. 2405UD65-10]|jgi:two-component system response regulator BaeR|uniref:response regulator n=1 Tax=Glaciecola sp. 2405UD65-10 TaxID=3397244 RepID=UPI003B599D71